MTETNNGIVRGTGPGNGNRNDIRNASRPSWSAELLDSSKFYDFTISCRGRKYCVHKAVLCIQSDFFEKACKACFREGEENVIPLDEDDPAVIDAMLQFLYLEQYTKERLMVSTNMSDLELSAQLYCAGDRYQIEKLKAFVVKEIRPLAKASIHEITFPNVVDHVFQNTVESDEKLREVLVVVALENVSTIFEGHGQRLKFIPDFMVHALKVAVKANTYKKHLMDTLDTHVVNLSKDIQKRDEVYRGLAKYQCSSCEIRFIFSHRLNGELRCPRTRCRRTTVEEVDTFLPELA